MNIFSAVIVIVISLFCPLKREHFHFISTVYFGTTCASRMLGIGTDRHVVASIKREAQLLEAL